MIHNMVSGGGQSDGPVEAGTIVVTYPSGATCTVTNGEKTYTALDTSGAAAFVVEPGTWTVMAEQGSDSNSKSVTVTAGGWVEVELNFWNNELYTPGNQWTNVTGGWQVIPVKTWTAGAVATVYALEESAEEIGVRWTANGSGATSKGVVLMPKNKIDLAGVNAINVKLGSQENLSGGLIPDTNFLFIMDAVISSSTVISTAAQAKKSITASDLGGELTLDVSAYSGMYYVGLAFCSNNNTPDNYCGLSSMILEVAA